jgi:3-hydroxybutyryl-CoA dehydratase
VTVQRESVSLAVGNELRATTKQLTQEQINRYADASGDHNPLHLDETFAKTTQFGGIIAHGMLVLAFVSEMLTASFGRDWLESGRLKIRFRAPARPGDTLTLSGHVTKVDGARIVCEIECRNGSGEAVLDGSAEITLS